MQEQEECRQKSSRKPQVRGAVSSTQATGDGFGDAPMPSHSAPDRSNGYEAAAAEFMARRTRSPIGAAVVRQWASSLPQEAAVLDLGCGPGVPISQALIDEGLRVHGVDASPTLITAFRARFPQALAECAAVEDSQFFGRAFDAVVAWGLMFLLSPENQATLIRKVAGVLNPGGKFLFTAPERACEWQDVLTGQTSVSLGSKRYEEILRSAGLLLDEEADDEGDNHYYFTRQAD
jgi:SAM-dependent methyltransferase